MTWLALNWNQVLGLVGAHLALSLPSIVVAVLIAVPLGRIAQRHPRLGGPVVAAASLFYSVPALPLLVVIPVVVGIPLRSPANMTIALTAYGVALLASTARDAFDAVDPRVREAAIATGHSRRSMLWLVDLPLATPIIVSGIRVVAVSTIGLVTIGALIGVSSLGTLLTDGFQRGIVAEVVTGIIATMALALILDGAIRALGAALTPWTRRGGAR